MRSPEPPLPLPSRLGRYELRAVLGRGGGGVVYEAVMLGLGGFRKRVALKVLGARDWQDDGARASLQREARFGALLSHPNVVAILDLGQDQDRAYLAMELVDGHPVSALINAGLIDPATLVEIGIATCAGLAHIHDLRIEGEPGALVHRDIKPQNLLADRNGTVKVADFGIAGLASQATGWAGTPTWMAPEQQRGQVSAASDLFALGAVLYALATGRAPFGVGETALAVAPQVEALLADPSFLAPIDSFLPGLGRIVGRCLRLDPALRHPSAQAVSAELRALRGQAGWSDLGARVGQVGAAPATRTAATGTTRTTSESGPRREDPLFGRSREVSELAAALAGGARRLALTGPGGMGKTRLARALADRITDGPAVWVEVGAAPSADGEIGLARAIGRALSVDLVREEPVRQLVAAIAALGRPTLFLDDADLARDALVPLLDHLRTAAPAARVVVTARAALHAAEEQVVPVRPLTVADGVALFEHRVGSPPSPADRAALPALVEALDGLPLAIELAAARARVLDVPTLHERLRDRFRLLVDPSRPGTSLRSAIATSFAMLRPWEARALCELSVFPGDFALEAAEAVLRLDQWPDAPWALDLLAVLLDASLVRLDRATGRFSLLHSVRDFAAETLDPPGRRAAEVRHGEHYAQLGSPEVDEALRRRRPEHIRRVESEVENLRAACERAVDRGDAQVAERTAVAAAAVYSYRGPFAVCAALLDRVLALPDLALRGPLLAMRWRVLGDLGRTAEAERDLTEAERIATAQGDRSTVHAAQTLGTLRLPAATATTMLRGLVTETRAHGDFDGEFRALSMLGSRLLAAGDLPAARATLEAARALAVRIGDGRGAALATMRLGLVDFAEGSIDEASHRFEAAERGFREIGDDTTATIAIENRAIALADAGLLEAARPLLESALQQLRRTGSLQAALNTTTNLGEVALRSGRVDEARSLLESALELARASDLPRYLALAEVALGAVEVHLGRREAAAARFTHAAEVLRGLGEQLEAGQADVQRWLLAVEAGSHDPGAAPAEIGASPARERPVHWVALGHLLLDRGDEAGAARALEGAREALGPAARLRWAEATVGVFAARLAAHAGELRRAARLLADADPALREEWQRVRLHQARAEIWLAHPDPAKAAGAVRDLLAAASRAGFGPDTPIRAAAARLGARARA